MLPICGVDYEVMSPYDWMVVLIDTLTGDVHRIHNDREKLKKLHKEFSNYIWVGYNCLQYDKPIQSCILDGGNPYKLSEWIVGGNPYWEYPIPYKSARTLWYDTSVGFFSLKQLEAFQGHSIEESKVPFGLKRALTPEEVEETFRYCENDVSETLSVFLQTVNEFNAHYAVISSFHRPIEDISTTQAQLAAKVLEAKRTKRDDEWEMDLPPNKVRKYRHVLDWLLSKEFPHNKLKTRVWDCECVFANGGAHGGGKIHFYADNEFIGIQSDVTALYPHLMIVHNTLSRNVPNPELFKNILSENKRLKREGKKAERTPYKRLSNITFGAAGTESNPLGDMRNSHRTCVYGMTLILDLAERLENLLAPYGGSLQQSNTDAVTCKVPRKLIRKYRAVCAEWERDTGLELEHDFYVELHQKDVNNYLMKFDDGTWKAKGGQVKHKSPLDNDLPIINKALREYFTEGRSIEDTIYAENSLIQFQKIYKLTSKFDYVTHNSMRYDNKCYRVFASKDGNDTPVYKWKENRPHLFSDCPNNARIVNEDITNTTVPAWLDRNYYVQLAKKKLESWFE